MAKLVSDPISKAFVSTFVAEIQGCSIAEIDNLFFCSYEQTLHRTFFAVRHLGPKTVKHCRTYFYAINKPLPVNLAYCGRSIGQLFPAHCLVIAVNAGLDLIQQLPGCGVTQPGPGPDVVDYLGKGFQQLRVYGLTAGCRAAPSLGR
jgi:hypothetical protein